MINSWGKTGVRHVKIGLFCIGGATQASKWSLIGHYTLMSAKSFQMVSAEL